MSRSTNSGFAFGCIHILQSLRPDDRETGRELNHFLQGFDGADERVDFAEVATRSELFEQLQAARADLESTGRVPILQIEAHGCPDGIELSSGEFVEWSELKKVLTEINVLSQLNLLVVMAACWGEWLVKMVCATDRAPLWGSLGARGKINENVLLDGMKVFYSQLLSGAGVREALEAMGGGMYYEGRPFVLWPAEYFFLTTYRGYLMSECSDAAVERRVELLTAKEASAGRLKGTDEVRATLRQGLKNHKPFFERFRQHFFMEDLYPGHRDRFKVSFSALSGAPVRDGT